MNPYLARLRADENLEKALPQSPTKPTEPTSIPLLSVLSVPGVALFPKIHSARAPLVHPQLRRALVRELWPADGCRCFIIDITVNAAVPLLDACPSGIEPAAWREAIVALTGSLLGRPIPRNYDEQPTLTFRPRRPDAGMKRKASDERDEGMASEGQDHE